MLQTHPELRLVILVAAHRNGNALCRKSFFHKSHADRSALTSGLALSIGGDPLDLSFIEKRMKRILHLTV